MLLVRQLWLFYVRRLGCQTHQWITPDFQMQMIIVFALLMCAGSDAAFRRPSTHTTSKNEEEQPVMTLGPWSEWSACSKECDGIQQRSRICTPNCPGEAQATHCNLSRRTAVFDLVIEIRLLYQTLFDLDLIRLSP